MNSLLYPELRWQASEILPGPWLGQRLEPQSKWYCLGSCFAERSAAALEQHLLSTCFAAGGPLYTPEAILRWMQLCELAGTRSFSEFQSELQRRTVSVAGRFLHPFTPGWMEAASAEALCDLVYKQCCKEYAFWQEAAVVLLTLGSSFSFYSEASSSASNSASSSYWSNGHRLPTKHKKVPNEAHEKNTDIVLEKKLLEPVEIDASLRAILELCCRVSPKAVFVCSVSPIRHNLASPLDNSLSKAQLLSAVHRLRRKEALYYLPAYEMIMDELRDYRWYDEQLKQLRLSSFALILQRLLEQCAGPELQAYLAEVVRIAKMLRHRGHRRHGQHELEGAEQAPEIAEQALSDLRSKYSSLALPESAEQYRAMLNEIGFF